jgi:DNA-binding NarL/FixJ family response regulator
MERTISVFVVEDDPRLRESLEQFLRASETCRCIGSCGSAEEALEQIPRLSPRVVIMDINLPKMSGVECVRQLKMTNPSLLIIMLTVYEDSDQIFGALQSGASGYLLKRTPPEALLNAIHEVCEGGAPMSGHIARKVVQSFQRPAPVPERNIQLTEREQQVLAYVAKGYINKEIAEALNVGLETVRSHLKNIYEKLHVRSRTEAALRFVKNGNSPE